LASLAQPKSAQELLLTLEQHGPKILGIVLVIALGIQAGVIVTGGTRTTAGTAAPAAHTHGSARALDMAVISNWHPFGAPKAQGSGSDAPETSAQLVLAGVLAVDDPQRGMAILGPNSATAKLYAAGADVPGGVRLHAVYKDRVLLDRNGALEALYLPRLSGATSAAMPAVASGWRTSRATTAACSMAWCGCSQCSTPAS
jgi:type II secretory pathway component PulC